MNINPNNKVRFTEAELSGLIKSTIKDIMSRNDNVICEIKCISKALDTGSRFQLKKYKSIDGSDHLISDMTIIGSETSSSRGPIMIEYGSPKIDMICDSIVSTILSTEDICFKIGSRLLLTCDILYTDNTANTSKGIIENVKSMAEEIYDKINDTKARYTEIEFTLDSPRKSFLVYIHTIRDKHMKVDFHHINISGSMVANIVSPKEDFITVFNEWREKIFKDFKTVSPDPAVRIKYYMLSENKELI